MQPWDEREHDGGLGPLLMRSSASRHLRNPHTTQASSATTLPSKPVSGGGMGTGQGRTGSTQPVVPQADRAVACLAG